MQNTQNNKAKQSQNVSRETKSLIISDWELYAGKRDGYYCFALEVETPTKKVYLIDKSKNHWILHDLGFDYEEVILECDRPIVDSFGNAVDCDKSLLEMVRRKWGYDSPSIIVDTHYTKRVVVGYQEVLGEEVVDVVLYN